MTTRHVAQTFTTEEVTDHLIMERNAAKAALAEAEAEIADTYKAINRLRDTIPCCSGDPGRTCMCCELQAILDGVW